VPRAPDPSCLPVTAGGFPDWDIWSVAPTEAWLALPPSMCNMYPPVDRDRRANLENPHDRSIRESWKEPRQAPRPAAGCLSRTCTCSSTTRPGPRDISFISPDMCGRSVASPCIFLLPEAGHSFVKQNPVHGRSHTSHPAHIFEHK
jgi:hypothetical protein